MILRWFSTDLNLDVSPVRPEMQKYEKWIYKRNGTEMCVLARPLARLPDAPFSIETKNFRRHRVFFSVSGRAGGKFSFFFRLNVGVSQV